MTKDEALIQDLFDQIEKTLVALTRELLDHARDNFSETPVESIYERYEGPRRHRED